MDIFILKTLASIQSFFYLSHYNLPLKENANIRIRTVFCRIKYKNKSCLLKNTYLGRECVRVVCALVSFLGKRILKEARHFRGRNNEIFSYEYCMSLVIVLSPIHSQNVSTKSSSKRCVRVTN